jgi:hypothetical protein
MTLAAPTDMMVSPANNTILGLFSRAHDRFSPTQSREPHPCLAVAAARRAKSGQGERAIGNIYCSTSTRAETLSKKLAWKRSRENNEASVPRWLKKKKVVRERR